MSLREGLRHISQLCEQYNVLWFSSETCRTFIEQPEWKYLFSISVERQNYSKSENTLHEINRAYALMTFSVDFEHNIMLRSRVAISQYESVTGIYLIVLEMEHYVIFNRHTRNHDMSEDIRCYLYLEQGFSVVHLQARLPD